MDGRMDERMDGWIMHAWIGGISSHVLGIDGRSTEAVTCTRSAGLQFNQIATETTTTTATKNNNDDDNNSNNEDNIICLLTATTKQLKESIN